MAHAVAARTHQAGATVDAASAAPTPSTVARSSARPSGSGSRPGRAPVAAPAPGSGAGVGADARRPWAGGDTGVGGITEADVETVETGDRVASPGGRVSRGRMARMAGSPDRDEAAEGLEAALADAFDLEEVLD